MFRDRTTKPEPGVGLRKGHWSTDGIVFHSAFNMRGGLIARDLSGYGNHGQILGPSWTTGRDGPALSFDGINDEINLGSQSFLSGATEFTISVWLNLVDEASDSEIFNINQHSVNEPLLFWRDHAATDHYAFLITDDAGHGGTTVYTSSSVPNYGQWEHVALVFRGGINTRLYINGIEDGASPFNTATIDEVESHAGGNVYVIGNDGGGNQELKGLMSRFSIRLKALSAAEIAELAQNSNIVYEPMWLPDVLAPVGVVGDLYYKTLLQGVA